jgi:hypothetical protein
MLIPEAANQFFAYMNHLFTYDWGSLILYVIRTVVYGACSAFLLDSMGMKNEGKMCVLLVVVDCTTTILEAFKG